MGDMKSVSKLHLAVRSTTTVAEYPYDRSANQVNEVNVCCYITLTIRLIWDV